MESASEEFLRLLRKSDRDGTFIKLTLGRYRGPDGTLRNLYVRPVTLRAGPHWSFLWRHATRDITKNHRPKDGLTLLDPLVGGEFATAHLFTTLQDAQLEFSPDGEARLKVIPHATTDAASREHDHEKSRFIPPELPWLCDLGVTTSDAAVREGMAAKFRQINRFVELLAPLLREIASPADRPMEIVDMGCGKGYLTFGIWQHLRDAGRGPVRVRGVELRPSLVELCNRTAGSRGCSGLEFVAGAIGDVAIESLDVLIALHACDTATDDAIARGIAAKAGLIVVAPCCHKELSPQLSAPPVLAPALRHGIFREREAEFVTDALRIMLLEWAGYTTRAFEFVSTEHTAKNLMITAARRQQSADERDAAAERARAFAELYGIKSQHLAQRLGFPLS